MSQKFHYIKILLQAVKHEAYCQIYYFIFSVIASINTTGRKMERFFLDEMSASRKLRS